MWYKLIAMIQNNMNLLWSKLKSAKVKLSSELTARQLMNSFLARLRLQFRQHRYHRQLSQLSWYLILGHPGSGKKSLMQYSGLHFISPHQLGPAITQTMDAFADYTWWFTQEAVFIAAANEEPETTQNQLKKLCKLLRKQRRNRPINGVIVTMSTVDLLINNPQQHQERMNDLLWQLRHLHQTLKTQLPIYLVFTQTDQLRGFTQFFNDLSKEELTQVWGLTIPLAAANNLNAALSFFEKGFDQLITKLKERVLWSFDSVKNALGRELIYAFPQQMQLLKIPLAGIIANLLTTLRSDNALQLRGLYFTSSIQTGTDYDLLSTAIGIQSNPLTPSKVPVNQEAYFTASLFYEVILPEGKILGYSLQAHRRKVWRFRLAFTLTPLIAVIWSFSCYQGYLTTREYAATTENQLTHYRSLAEALRIEDTSLLTVLPLLNLLSDIKHTYENSSFTSNILIAKNRLASHSQTAFTRILNNVFQPRIAAHLEEQLRQPHIDDANVLYAILKGYLAFSPSRLTEPRSVIAPMLYEWESQLPHNPQLQRELRHYLDIATQQRLEELPLDRSLINKIRLQLQQLNPADRAYGLLTFKAVTSNVSDLDLPSRIGDHYFELFRANNSIATIPALYTQTGFEYVFLKNYRFIAHQVANDNVELGLNNDNLAALNPRIIRLKMEQNYDRLYLKTWHDNLNSIQIKPTSDWSELNAQLTLLTSNQSPFTKLFSIIADNTATVRHQTIDIAQSFADINHFSQGTSNTISYKTVLDTLTQLRQTVIQLQQSPDPDKASFVAAKETMLGNPQNPLTALSLEAQQAPPPVNQWLQTIADNCWNSILQGALRYINNTWTTQVMSEYDAQIKDRYPINAASQSQMSMEAFTHFFAPKGTLQQFYDHTLSPFIDTRQPQWKVITLNHHALTLSSDTISLFQRAEAIRGQYFANNSLTPTILLSLQPLTLSHSAAGINLNIGNTRINYQHGPQLVTNITWPLTPTAEESKAVITTFSNQHYALSANGPWSLFQLIDRGDLHNASTPSEYQLTFSLEGQKATFVISSPSTLETLYLHELKGLELPNQLISLQAHAATESKH